MLACFVYFHFLVDSLISECFSVGNLLFLAVVSHFGARLHRPRLIGMGCFIMAIGSAVTGLPHFFMGRQVHICILSLYIQLVSHLLQSCSSFFLSLCWFYSFRYKYDTVIQGSLNKTVSISPCQYPMVSKDYSNAHIQPSNNIGTGNYSSFKVPHCLIGFQEKEHVQISGFDKC